MSKHTLKNILFIFIISLLDSFTAFSQLPQCDYLYMDQYNLFLGSTQNIYNYNPLQPISAANPTLNTIQMPNTDNGGLTVSEVLGSGNTTLTFYTVIDDKYWYYDPVSLAWVNTNHSTGDPAAVNIASGGGFIYNLAGATGKVYRYDGTSDGTLLVTLPDFAGDSPYDLIADCPGNFYILNTTITSTNPYLRKYDPSGTLIQSWVLNNPNNYIPAGGFGIINTNIYLDNLTLFGLNLSGIVSGSLNAATVDLTNITAALPTYPILNVIGDLGSCAASVPTFPEITISIPNPLLCSTDPAILTSVITIGGSNPMFQWYVNGIPVPGAVNSTYTYFPNSNDVVTCTLVSSNPCASIVSATSNQIILQVEDGTLPTLMYDNHSLCFGTKEAIPTFTPLNGSFSSSPAGLSIDPLTGIVSSILSEVGVYIVKYTKQPGVVCPLLSATDTITILPTPSPKIILEVNNHLMCQNDTVRFKTEDRNSYIYEWSPSKYFPFENYKSNVKGFLYKAGSVYVNVTNKEGCTAIDSLPLDIVPCCYVMIPNAFSPNGDGINDKFRINSLTKQYFHQLSIFNRWGERIFSSTEQSKGWDGSYKNKMADGGDYHYYLSYECSNGQNIERKGILTLIR